MISPKLFMKDQAPIVLPVQPVSGVGALSRCSGRSLLVLILTAVTQQSRSRQSPESSSVCICCSP